MERFRAEIAVMDQVFPDRIALNEVSNCYFTISPDDLQFFVIMINEHLIHAGLSWLDLSNSEQFSPTNRASSQGRRLAVSHSYLSRILYLSFRPALNTVRLHRISLLFIQILPSRMQHQRGVSVGESFQLSRCQQVIPNFHVPRYDEHIS